ncbi:prepilin-type N-terminal cleavage/methylation domain-containing protein [Rheinheimera sediminis]|uniref:prepilin-type N-terminal cleavage/methylation domain-containing protein n=1 Tax=Rheinheimera sp. YQF-1 TaxID=2499626 RepID=UPI000FD75739|nr:prepilin-type N-terminal cleavage/methylation domain-containing protein [Rheinheimera sp. YQF-1]RVT45973.1 prepilin-type N-terminal cleavage/methylation domain-containing protein [Rheinheimera sp. YQF-1]
MKVINKNQQGFTLVELIIVIVILGILAVTAAPRFLNFQGDAKASVLEGVAGSLKSGLKIVEGKAIIAGLNTAALSCFDTATNSVIAATGTTPACDTATGSTQVALNFGSPAMSVDSVRAIAEFTGDIAVVLVPATPEDNTVTPPVAAVPASIVIANNATDAAATGCRVVYTPATATTTPATVTVDAGTCN